MKFIMKHGKSEKDIKNLRQEIEILRNLEHENIIQMLDSFETKTDFCVVTEFAHGSLQLACCKYTTDMLRPYDNVLMPHQMVQASFLRSLRTTRTCQKRLYRA